MKSTIMKTTLREIRESLGRYVAILAIVALGVGLYVGLTVTTPDMLAAGENYLEENNCTTCGWFPPSVMMMKRWRR